MLCSVLPSESDCLPCFRATQARWASGALPFATVFVGAEQAWAFFNQDVVPEGVKKMKMKK